jgi:O-antigen ligase
VLFLKSLGSNIDQRIAATVERTESGKESRLDLWQSAWEDFLDHPLTGRAMEGRYDIYPHNLLIESFMATGMFGGGAFLWALLLGLRAAFRLIGRSSEYGWIGFLFIQMTVYGCFSGSLWSLSGFWYMLAAVLVYGHGACVTAALPATLRQDEYVLTMSNGREYRGWMEKNREVMPYR